MFRGGRMIKHPQIICEICGQPCEGYGNNAEPLSKGKCCDECNTLVIRKRIMLIDRDMIIK